MNDTANVQEIAEALVRDGVAPDAAVGWAARTGRGWEIVAGRASAAGRPSFEPIFDLASVTKPMTAVAIARSGIDPRTPLGELLDEARGTPTEHVPLELVLAHRAGLEAHVSLYEPLLGGGLVDRSLALHAAASARRRDALGPLPAEGFAPVYSDLGYVLAGAVLARTLGTRDAGEAIERVLAIDDLGTARSLDERGGFRERVRPTEIVGWRGGEVRGVVHDENAWALTGEGGSGHAGMFGTVHAVLRFGCDVLDAVRDLDWLVRPRPNGTLRAGFDGKSTTGSSVGAIAGPRTFGHLGFTGTSLWIDPDAETLVAVLTNRVHPTRENMAIRAARPVAHDALFALAAEARA